MSIVSHFAGSAMQNTPKSDDLGNDLVIGMRAIAEFWGMPERKAYYMASKGLLPGVFQLGKQWTGSKSVSRDAVRSRAEGRLTR